MERAIERSDIKIDVAACIRNAFLGVAAIILAIGIVMHSQVVSMPNAVQAVARIFIK